MHGLVYPSVTVCPCVCVHTCVSGEGVLRCPCLCLYVNVCAQACVPMSVLCMCLSVCVCVCVLTFMPGSSYPFHGTK